MITITSFPSFCEAAGITNSSPWRSITASISFKRNQLSNPNAGTLGVIGDCSFRIWQNSEKSGELKKQLHGYGISAFVAHNDIEPTTEWQDEIEKALATCDAMVVLMREGFHASKWTDQEIGYAMGRGRMVIAVRLGQDPYGFIGRFQAISGGQLTSTALATQIFDILKKSQKRKTGSSRGWWQVLSIPILSLKRGPTTWASFHGRVLGTKRSQNVA